MKEFGQFILLLFLYYNKSEKTMEIQNETILDYKQVFNVAMKNMQKIRYVAFLL